MALYTLDGVSGALGASRRVTKTSGDTFDDYAESEVPNDTEHQARLGAILAQGEAGRWRHAVGPGSDAEAKLSRLAERAPHLAEVSGRVRMNIRAARNMAMPVFLGPLLLVGAPGVGKTWYLSRLGAILGVPFRSYSMSTSTLGDGLQGSHPSWRNAAPGLVARTLLREDEANPIIFVDEIDKAQPGGWNADPYRPFYTLLDPSGSRGFVDEYLGFEIDASKVLWVMAANDCSSIPAPILDRLTVVQMPEMTPTQRISVCESIYLEANLERRGYFEPGLSPPVLERLASLNPRSMRIALEDAIARAAADGRRAIAEQDVRPRQEQPKWRAGFR